MVKHYFKPSQFRHAAEYGGTMDKGSQAFCDELINRLGIDVCGYIDGKMRQAFIKLLIILVPDYHQPFCRV